MQSREIVLEASSARWVTTRFDPGLEKKTALSPSRSIIALCGRQGVGQSIVSP